MTAVQTTPHPHKYYLMELIEEVVPKETWDKSVTADSPTAMHKTGDIYIRFHLAKHIPMRKTAQLMGKVYCDKPIFHRDREERSIYNKGYYKVSGWIINGNEMVTDRFSLNGLLRILDGLKALYDHGYRPDGEISICLADDTIDLRQALNIHTMLEAKKQLLEQALGLSDELRIIFSYTPALSLPLGAFDLLKIEAAVFVLHQMSIQAKQTRSVRMKPTENVNPRYQLRTWLLRLGFIGDAFARPRQTLLENLEGSSAFFHSDRHDLHHDNTSRRQIG